LVPGKSEPGRQALIYRFTLPFALPTGNVIKKMHWAAYGRHRNRISSYVLGSLGRGSVQSPVIVQVRCYRLRVPDTDNAAFGCKPLYDSLVRLGWAVDDKPAWMRMVPPETVIVRKRSEQRTEVTLQVGS